jgi:chloramphenicol 3-O-phosphotransferase
MHFAGKTRIATLFKDQFSHAYLSVTIEQFHFAFGGSLLNHIKAYLPTFSPTYGTS